MKFTQVEWNHFSNNIFNIVTDKLDVGFKFDSWTITTCGHGIIKTLAKISSCNDFTVKCIDLESDNPTWIIKPTSKSNLHTIIYLRCLMTEIKNHNFYAEVSKLSILMNFSYEYTIQTISSH